MSGKILWQNRLPTPEELAQMEAERIAIDRVEAEAEHKRRGVEFEGVMCSATSQDQAGLTAVLLAIQLQGEAFPATRFYFENGNTLVIHLGNYRAFMSTWLPFRQSFFMDNRE